jgi:hypothetical protein
MPYSHLLPNIAEATRDQLIAEVNQLRTAMDYLVLLNQSEKKKHLQLGNRAEPFFDRTVVLAESNPNILTNVVSVPNLRIRTNDHKSLKAIQSQINRLNDAVNCTVIALEQENMRDCLYIYKLAQGAAAQNVPGAVAIVQALESLLPRSGKKSMKKTDKNKRLITEHQAG